MQMNFIQLSRNLFLVTLNFIAVIPTHFEFIIDTMLFSWKFLNKVCI